MGFSTLGKWGQLPVMAIVVTLLGLASFSRSAEQDVSDFTHKFRPTSAHQMIRHTNTQRNAGKLNGRGRTIFDPNIRNSMGGVIAQASIEYPQDAEIPILYQWEHRDRIRVRVLGKTFVYRISYDDVVPMALFIEGGGTALYTAFTPDDPEFQAKAGFVSPTEIKEGLIALEFGGTKYEKALQFIDSCVVLCHEQIPPDSSEWESYINHDVGQRYSLSLAKDVLSVAGSVLRTYWKEGPDGSMLTVSEIPISSVNHLVKKTSLACKVLTSRPSKKHEKKHQLALRTACDEAVQRYSTLLKDAHELYRTLALLRTVKELAPTEWTEFLNYLMSEDLVAQSTSIWYRYTDSFCSTYPDQCTEGPETSIDQVRGVEEDT